MVKTLAVSAELINENGQIPVGTVESMVTVSLGTAGEVTYRQVYVRDVAGLNEVHAWVKRQSIVGIDFETDGLDPFTKPIATLQIGNPLVEEPTAFVVDVRCFTKAQLTPLLKTLESPKIRKIGQNLTFECRFALAHYGINFWNLIDTQKTEMTIRAGLLSTAKSTADGADEGSRVAYGAASMGALCRRYLGLSIDKDTTLRTSFYSTPAGQHNQRQLNYAAGDVIYVFYLHREQWPEVQNRALENIVRLEHKLVPILAKAEHDGMRLDTGKWLDLWQEAKVKKLQVEREIHRMLLDIDQTELLPPTGDTYKVLYPRKNTPLNLDSPEQVQWAIAQYCSKINWPVTLITTLPQLKAVKLIFGRDWLARNKTKKVMDVPDYLIPEDKYCILLSTNAENLRLARLKKQLPANFVTLILEQSKYSILSSTFGKDFITKHVKHDGRIHPEYHQVITSTGRLSASPNSMNIPQDARYRHCFIPADGYDFVIADYSQIEPRLSAQESMDPVYLETFKHNDDIYLKVAEAMSGHRPDKSTEEGGRARQIFKTIVLAMAYRMGPSKLQRRLALSLEKDILEGKADYPQFDYVRSLHKGFLETFDKLHDYQNKCSEQADPNAKEPRVIWDIYLNGPVTWVSALCGRKRFFPSTADNTYTEASNAPIQGCSATITKTAMVLIQEEIFKHGFDARLVNIVHDELVYECRKDQSAAFAPIMKAAMEFAGQYYMPDVPVKTEFPKGTNGVVSHWTK